MHHTIGFNMQYRTSDVA